MCSWRCEMRKKKPIAGSRSARRHGCDTPYQVFSAFEDVTDLRRAEAEWRAADQANARLLESISDCFYSLDRNLCFTYVNGAAERQLACRREEVLGRHLIDC